MAFLLAACASGGTAPPGPPAGPADPALAEAAVRATAISRPLQMVFEWSLQESDARFSGRGVTRFAPPSSARLDLFGPRDETVLAAALIDQRLRLPAGAADAPLPPPALLWSLLGTFQPPEGATLTTTQRDGSTVVLGYVRGDERWTFRLENDVLRHAEWVGPGEGRRTIELDGTGAHGLPARAVYRDWRAFRELRVNLQEVIEVDGFPADIWNIGG